MSRYIDADKLTVYFKALAEMAETEGLYNIGRINKRYLRLVEEAPTADVVAVVRCKDCIHWGGVTYGFICRKFSGLETKVCMGANHYCSYGERKEECGG